MWPVWKAAVCGYALKHAARAEIVPLVVKNRCVRTFVDVLKALVGVCSREPWSDYSLLAENIRCDRGLGVLHIPWSRQNSSQRALNTSDTYVCSFLAVSPNVTYHTGVRTTAESLNSAVSAFVCRTHVLSISLRMRCATKKLSENTCNSTWLDRPGMCETGMLTTKMALILTNRCTPFYDQTYKHVTL